MSRSPIRVTAIFINQGKLLLVHRLKDDSEYWVFPGGGLEVGETEEEALRREVKEETNLEISSFRKLSSPNLDDGHIIPVFYCQSDSYEDMCLNGPEKDEQTENNVHLLEWVDLDALPQSIYPPGVSQIVSNLDL